MCRRPRSSQTAILTAASQAFTHYQRAAHRGPPGTNDRRRSVPGVRHHAVHDIHATILHLLGLNHRQLTFDHNGRDERATINGGRVIMQALA
jgi:hypothetical protein